MPPSLVCGAGADCGIAAGWGGLSCTCDGGVLRGRVGATCGVAALGSWLASAGGWPACDGSALRWPEFGFWALQSATSCKLICGKGRLARRGCDVPRMMGTMQSTKRPSPDLAPPCTNPASSQAALISVQAGWRGAACTETAAPRPTRSVPRKPRPVHLHAARPRRSLEHVRSGGLPPPSPPAEKATARKDQGLPPALGSGLARLALDLRLRATARASHPKRMRRCDRELALTLNQRLHKIVSCRSSHCRAHRGVRGCAAQA